MCVCVCVCEESKCLHCVRTVFEKRSMCGVCVFVCLSVCFYVCVSVFICFSNKG